eukprot:scaffold345863_cov23-Prasinocladus_malaysianus.AAC.1
MDQNDNAATADDDEFHICHATTIRNVIAFNGVSYSYDDGDDDDIDVDDLYNNSTAMMMIMMLTATYNDDCNDHDNDDNTDFHYHIDDLTPAEHSQQCSHFLIIINNVSPWMTMLRYDVR